MSVPLLLSPEHEWLVESVARRVVELLEERDSGRPKSGLVDAQTIARMLGVSRSTVYEHAEEFGAVQLGDGKRARLRFDPEQARAAWTPRDQSETSLVAEPPPAGVVRRRRGSAARAAVELLPVRQTG